MLLMDISESIFEILQEHYKTQYLSNKSKFEQFPTETLFNEFTEFNELEICSRF